MAEPYVFERAARRPAAMAMVAGAILFLLVLIFGISAHPLVVAVFALLTGPAIWEVWQNRVHCLSLDDTHIRWQSGSQEIEIALADLQEVRTRTAFDLSQRATLYHTDNQRWKIPMPCLPPGKVLDAELEKRGVKVTRTIFGS